MPSTVVTSVHRRFGGTPHQQHKVKINDDGEVMLKGPQSPRATTSARHAANAQAFDEEGYFHTGDAGYMKNGELFLTDRIRTSSSRQATAKYIAPQMVEAMLLVDKFIDR